MAASEAASITPDKGSFGKVIAVQVVAYIILAVLSLVPGISYGDPSNPAIVSPVVIASVSMIVLLTVFSPFRDGAVGHVISVVAGLLSVVCATTMMLGRVIFPTVAGHDDFWMQEGWIAGVGGLLIVLIVVCFGRQMARERRTHLIRSLSHNVVEGVAMIACAGWCFLPTLLANRGDNAAASDSGSAMVRIIALVVVAAVVVGFAVCSYLWRRDADPEPTSRKPWMGIALLPVMLSGIVVGLASYATVVL
ncbi:hypothetical protein [uncultured Bifidobacterium sp.]|uniref:hypothetical protein n=1 Tax=uncultured Bifidobacterium sp. TaxID=165187 RepID=UPI000ED71ECE|nr:hypothetical protein [uncultured Bifidobacterium sp.]HCA73528.1 hypothetical protein [Bifidobacterium sp.]